MQEIIKRGTALDLTSWHRTLAMASIQTREPIFAAACSNRLAELKRLAEESPNRLVAIDADGFSIVHHLVASTIPFPGGHPRIWMWLLEQPIIDTAFLTLHGNYTVGAQAIHAACALNSLRTVQLLHANGVPLDAATDSGLQPIHLACQHFDVSFDLVKWLAERVSVEATDDSGFTCVHSAALNGSRDLMAWLIEDRHMELHARSGAGVQAIHLACQHGHHGLVRWLLDKGAAVEAEDARSWRPLHYACYFQSARTAKLLLTHGKALVTPADLPALPHDGKTLVDLVEDGPARTELARSELRSLLHSNGWQQTYKWQNQHGEDTAQGNGKQKAGTSAKKQKLQAHPVCY